MANKLIFTVEMDDKGKMKLLSQNADAAAKSTEKLSNAQDRNTMSSSEQTKKQKGVAQAGMNSTKAFSKMTSGIQGGLVPAYAALASHVFAVTAGFGVLKRAAAFGLLEEGLIRVGAAAGQNLPAVSRELRAITGEAISSEAAMRATAVAVSAGFGTDQLIQLTKVAKGASVALGRDMGDALDRLVRGTAKLEPEILDELGIMVRLDDAVADYAISLNKTSQELSQFERRQAFLNATINQGLQKFGLLAETSDVNPYDKLSASFDNLAKSGLGMLNQLLIPLIEVLSTNPGILIGALVLLGKGVAKQVLPTISEAANTAKKAAKQTGDATKAVMKTMETNVKKSIDKIGSFKFASAAVRDMEEDMRAGKKSVAELEVAIKKLQKSDEARSRNLKDDDTTSKKGLERQSVRRLRREIEGLIVTEKQRLAGSNALIRVKAKETMASSKAAAMAKMESGGVKNTLTAMIEGIAAQGKTVRDTTGHMNKLRLSTTALGNSAKIAGVGMMALAGPIGVAIMTISMFQEQIKSLLNWMGFTSIAVDENMETFGNFTRINDELSISYERSTNELQNYEAGLRAMVGVTDQVTSAYARQSAARVAAEDETLKNAIIEQNRIEKTVEQLKISRQKILAGQASLGETVVGIVMGAVQGVGVYTGFMDGAADAILNVGAAKKAVETFNKKEGMDLVARVKAEVKNNTELFALMGDNFDKYTKVEAQIESGALNTIEGVTGSLKGIGAPFAEILAAVDGAAESTKNFRNNAAKIGKTGKGMFSQVIDDVQQMQNDMKDLSGQGLELYLKKSGRMKATLEKSFDIKPLLGPNGYKIALVSLGHSLQANQDIILNGKEEQKRLNSLGQKQVALGRSNAEIMAKGLETLNEAKRAKISMLDAEEANFILLDQEEEKKDRIKEIDAQRATILAEIQDITRVQVQVDVAAANNAMKMLKLSQKMAKEGITRAQNSLAIAANEREIAALQSGNAIGPQGELNTFIKLIKPAKEAMLKAEFNMRLEMINAEYGLLAAQTRLARQKALDINGDITEYDTMLKLIPKLDESASISAKSSLDLGMSALELTEAQLRNKAKTNTESLSASGGGVQAMFDNIEMVDGKPVAGPSLLAPLVDDKAKFSEKQAALEGFMNPMMESMAKLGPEGEFVNSITAGVFSIGDAFSTMNDNLEKSTDGMMSGAAKAQMIGSAFSAVGDMMAAKSSKQVAGIDKEIAAEKKKDGKSKESLAKIAALEKKKEATKKKAFETNKKVQMAVTVANTAAAMMAALSPTLGLGPVAGIPLAAMAAAMGAVQLAVIAGTSYQGGGTGAPAAPTKPAVLSMGSRDKTVDLAKSKSASGELGYLRGASGMGGAENFKPAFSGARYRAAGGATTGYVVGEQGPELFMPDTPGTIVPNDDIGQPAPMNVNFNISALDGASVEGMLLDQRGSIINMLRDAANTAGEDFFEGVDTTDYTPSASGARSY